MRNTSFAPSKKRLAASVLQSAHSLAPSTAPWSVLILLIALSATSCKSLTPTPTTLTRTDTLIVCQTRTDTLIHFRPDSAAVFALLRCDSLGQVLIDSIASLQGHHLRTNFKLHPNGIQTAIEVRSLLPPDSTRVPISTTTIRQSSAASSLSQTTPAAPSLSSRLGGFLQALGLILIGIILGFIARSLI